MKGQEKSKERKLSLFPLPLVPRVGESGSGGAGEWGSGNYFVPCPLFLFTFDFGTGGFNPHISLPTEYLTKPAPTDF